MIHVSTYIILCSAIYYVKFCVAVLAAAAAVVTPETFEMSSDSVSAAASATTGFPSPIQVLLQAHATNIQGGLALASTALMFEFFGAPMLVPTPGATTYSVLDTNIKLYVQVASCGGQPDSSLQVKWYWRPVEGTWTLWTSKLGVVQTQLLMPVSTLHGPGHFEIKAAISGVSPPVETIFNITITDVPPPTAQLAMPAKAWKGCDFTLDASGSNDPGGTGLSFVWSCADDNTSTFAGSNVNSASCEASVEGLTTSTITIAGGSLNLGAYTFFVTVSSVAGQASAQGTIIIDSLNGPVVSIAAPPAEASPQQPLNLQATFTQSAGCVAPAWKAW